MMRVDSDDENLGNPSNDEGVVKGVEKGDLVVVRWTDASDRRAPLEDHLGDPSTTCKDWGVYLGITGTRRKFLLVGKDIVEVHNEWGATRIPLELVEDVSVILSRNKVLSCIREVLVLGRKVRLRKRRREVTFVRMA